MPEKIEVTGDIQNSVNSLIKDLKDLSVSNPQFQSYTAKLQAIGDECVKISIGCDSVVPLLKTAHQTFLTGDMKSFSDKWAPYKNAYSTLNAETTKTVKDGKMKVPAIPAELKNDSTVIKYYATITKLVEQTTTYFTRLHTNNTSMTSLIKKAQEIKNQRLNVGGQVAPAAANGGHSVPLSSSFGSAQQNSQSQARQNNANSQSADVLSQPKRESK
jgi:hypothetical protein